MAAKKTKSSSIETKGIKPDKVAESDKNLAAATAAVDELTAQVTTLRSRVRSLESEAEAWRAKALRNKSRVKKLRRQVDHAIAEATASARRRGGKAKDVITDHAPPEQRSEVAAVVLTIVEEPAPIDSPAGPDVSWTVARLRVEARAQSVTGCSRMTKAQLLESLSR